MAVDADAVRDRATVEERLPGTDLDAETMWIAEDPVTGCAGAGRVEAEAVGNLVAVVADYDGGPAKMKIPGRTIDRPDDDDPTPGGSLFDRLGSLFQP
jgi:hypothetical protein